MIKELLKKYKEIILYVIVGGCTTIVSIGSYALFTRVFHLDIYTSSIISWILAVLFAYFANKIIVFQSKNKIKKEIASFFGLRIVSLVLDLLTMWVLCDIIHLNDLIAKLIVQVIVLTSNYIFSKFFIFRRKS